MEGLKDAGYSDFNAADAIVKIFKQVDIEIKRHEDPAFREAQGPMLDTTDTVFMDAQGNEISKEEFLAA